MPHASRGFAGRRLVSRCEWGQAPAGRRAVMKAKGLCLVVAFLSGAAAGAHAASVEEIANLSGPDRQKILEDGARKEGELLWIGGFNEDNARPIIAGFTARYPFIKLNRVRSDGIQALQRVLAELRAKTPHTDLITADTVVDLEKANAVQAFKSPVLESWPAEDRDPTGLSAPLYFNYYGLAAFNKDQVTAAEAPKTYEDLLDPKWKGQMVINNNESGGLFLISFLRMHWGDAKAEAYLEKLAQQKIVQRTESARTVLGLVASGDYKIMIYPHLTHVGELARKGAPIDVTMVDPVPVSDAPFLLVKSAPHPYATMLLIDYLLGPEAQGMLRDAGYFPANPAVAPAAELKPYQPEEKGLGKFLVDDRAFDEMMPELQAWYARLFE
jgi:ABC-type Fe3+ transport system substrate-binding protein